MLKGVGLRMNCLLQEQMWLGKQPPLATLLMRSTNWQKTNTRILFKEMHICKYTNTDQNVTDLSNISVWKSGKIRNFLFLCSQNKQIANSGGNSFIRIYQSWIAIKKLYENCIAEKIRGSRPFDLIHSFHFPFSTLILYLLEPQIWLSIKKSPVNCREWTLKKLLKTMTNKIWKSPRKRKELS